MYYAHTRERILLPKEIYQFNLQLKITNKSKPVSLYPHKRIIPEEEFKFCHKNWPKLNSHKICLPASEIVSFNIL